MPYDYNRNCAHIETDRAPGLGREAYKANRV